MTGDSLAAREMDCDREPAALTIRRKLSSFERTEKQRTKMIKREKRRRRGNEQVVVILTDHSTSWIKKGGFETRTLIDV